MNKIIQILRRGMVQAAVQGQATSHEVLPGHNVLVPVEMGTQKMTLKTIDIVANKDAAFYVELYETASMSKSMYNSDIVTGRNYDIVDMVYISQEPSTKCYVYIVNKSEYPMTFDIMLRGLELQ